MGRLTAVAQLMVSARIEFPRFGTMGIVQVLIWVQTPPVEYRGIRYTIRVGIEREQWSVAIHPAGVEMPGRVITGPRERAELLARSMINRWLAAHVRKSPNAPEYSRVDRCIKASRQR